MVNDEYWQPIRDHISYIEKLCKDEFGLDVVLIWNNSGVEFPIVATIDDCVVLHDYKNVPNGRYQLDDKKTGKNLATFGLSLLPSTADVTVSHDAEVRYKYRNKGLGTALTKMREIIAFYAGSMYILCKVNNHNDTQCKIITKRGWTFTNPNVDDPKGESHRAYFPRIYIKELTKESIK